MSPTKILILDYSTDRSEAAATRRWLPANADVSSLFIDTEESFPEDLIDHGFTHIIHSGSALSITETAPFVDRAVAFIQVARDRGVSQMGICYGHQLLCRALVGRQAVRACPNGLEAGWRRVAFINGAMALLGVGENELVWQHHFDEVTELPDGSVLLATNQHSSIQAYINPEQRLLGTQFHPEFDREVGNQIFLEDRALLEKNGYDADELVKQGPSFDVGRVFFGFFLKTAA
jgi:GMP synthase-like glutamine amidotransferase